MKNRLGMIELTSGSHFKPKQSASPITLAVYVTLSTFANSSVCFDFCLQGLPGPPGPKVRCLASRRGSKVINREVDTPGKDRRVHFNGWRRGKGGYIK